jgi:signal transduction histidine kinase
LDALESSFPARAELQPFIEKLRREVERLGRLMSDLLQYGKPGSNERASYPLGEVLARAVAHCEPIAARVGVVLRSRFNRAALPALLIERERLVRVFQNLLENAIEHSGSGGTVSIGAAVVEIDGTPNVECHVIDSGAGFAPVDLPRVFEPFFTRRQSGTGLGLSIVQRIVREHGGTVSAGNSAHGGAVVTVRLPIPSEVNGR